MGENCLGLIRPTGAELKTTLMVVGAAAALALIPAVAGLAGNPALSRRINMVTTPTLPTNEHGVGEQVDPGDAWLHCGRLRGQANQGTKRGAGDFGRQAPSQATIAT